MLYRIGRKLTPPGMAYSSLVFFCHNLGNISHPATLKNESLAYQMIDSAPNRLLALLCEKLPEKQFHLRPLQGSQLAFIVTANCRPVAYAWVTMAPCIISELNVSFAAGKHGVYIYDCFVFPGYRGQGIYQSMLQRILAEFDKKYSQDGQYQHAFIAAEPGNLASIRGIQNAGFTEVARARYITIGQRSRLFSAGELPGRATIGQLPTASPAYPLR